MASHEHNLLPFGTPQSYPLLSAQSKKVSAANNKERLGECHDILCCRTILVDHVELWVLPEFVTGCVFLKLSVIENVVYKTEFSKT